MNRTSNLSKLKQLDKMTPKQQQEFWKKYLKEGEKNETSQLPRLQKRQNAR